MGFLTIDQFKSGYSKLVLPQIFFLQCAALQKIFASRLGEDKSSRTFPFELDHQAKRLLQQQRQTFVSMAKWEISIIESISWDESLLSFTHLLKQCKLTKFREFNFKLLHRILATLVVISVIQKVASVALCSWCGSRADIDHILLTCPDTLVLYTWIQDILEIEISPKHRILGCGVISPVIWVTNFAIYKAHLMATSGYRGPLQDIARQMYKCYTNKFSLLQDLYC